MLCRAVRLALCDLLSECERQAARAHRALVKNPGDTESWEFLVFHYRNRRRIEGTILLLGEGRVRTRREWMEGQLMDREQLIDYVLLAGGVFDDQERFVEVQA